MSKVKRTLRSKGLYTKFVKLKLQYRVACVIMLVSTLWLVSGLFVKEAIQQTANVSAEQASVQVEEFHSQERTVYLSVTGVTEALYSVDIIPEVSGKVLDILVKDGSKVKQGDVLLRIEEYERLEQLEQSQAILKQRELEYEASQSLNEKGYRSEIQAAASFAALQAAQTEVKRSKISWENTSVKIPFSGYIDKINVQKGDLIAASVGKTIAKVVNFDQIKIIVYVSEKDINKVKLNSIVQVTLANGHDFDGKVSFISRVINSATRTYRVEIKATDANNNFPVQGITADVKLPINTAQAHKIPASALSLDDRGVIGVKVVNQDSVVSFIPVEIIDDDKDGLWITHAPEVMKLIILGHPYVNSGDKVKIS